MYYNLFKRGAIGVIFFMMVVVLFLQIFTTILMIVQGSEDFILFLRLMYHDSENVGFLGSNRIGSRRVIQVIVGFMIFFSMLGKFGALFSSIRFPIFAALFGACIHILIRDKDISNHNFVFYSDRLIRLLSMVSVICLSPKSKLPLQQDLSVLVLISERNYMVFQLFEGELSFELGIDFCRSSPNDRSVYSPLCGAYQSSSNKLWVNLLSSKYLMEDQNLDATVILGASCVCKTIPMTTEVHKLGFMTGKGEVSLWYCKWLEINYLCNLVL
ncbi:uridine kinase [Trifolium repens]|nr:uridine kinase [Trifolium repens]